jgi:hypothetical protein
MVSVQAAAGSIIYKAMRVFYQSKKGLVTAISRAHKKLK